MRRLVSVSLLLSVLGACHLDEIDPWPWTEPDAAVNADFSHGHGSMTVEDGTSIYSSTLGVSTGRWERQDLDPPYESVPFAWSFKGSSPEGCDSESDACFSLVMMLPLNTGLGPRPCENGEYSVKVHVHDYGAPHYTYEAKAGDACTFTIVDDPTSRRITIRDLDATVTTPSRTYRVTGEMAGYVPVRYSSH